MARIAMGILLSLLIYAVPASAQNMEQAIAELADRGYNYSGDAFEAAATANDYPAIMLFLQSGIDPNVFEPGETPALISAAQNGNRFIVETLLKHGADVNIPDHSGATALYYAVENEFPATVQALLKYGADPNVRGADALTPLMLAARQDRGEMARLLLEYGADINAVDENGWTALAYAVDYGSEKVYNILQVRYAELYPRQVVTTPPKIIVTVQPPYVAPE